MGQKLEEMTDEEFKTGVDSVLTIVSEKDKNQKEEFTRFWAELNRHKYQFDRQEKEIQSLKHLTKAEFQSYARAILLSGTSKRLDVHYNSSNTVKAEAA